MNAPVRQRAIVGPDTRPLLPRHVRLQFDPVRERWALLSPEKIMWPDEVSLEILRLCDGSLSITDIAARLATDYDAPAGEIEVDVTAFVQEWTDRMLVRT